MAEKSDPVAGLDSYDGSLSTSISTSTADDQASLTAYLGDITDLQQQQQQQQHQSSSNIISNTTSATNTPSLGQGVLATDIKTDDFSSRASNSGSSVVSASPSKARAGSSKKPRKRSSISQSQSQTQSPSSNLASNPATTASAFTSTLGPESTASASAAPSLNPQGLFFPQPDPSSWGFYPNIPNAAAAFGSINPAAVPSGFYNPQFQFAAQQWPFNAAPQFSGDLPQRPRVDSQLPQQDQDQQQPGQLPPDALQQLQQQQFQQQQELLFRLQQQQQFLQQQQQPQQQQQFAQPDGSFGAQTPVRPNVPPEVLNSLTPAQQETLKSIAMPAHLQYHSPKSEPSPQSSTGGGIPSSPDGLDPSKANSRKRKSSAEDDDDDDDDDDNDQPVKKTAHNMIEKRYRTNLNDKIAALRDSVPSLRIMSKSARGEDTTEDREELHGLTPAHKLNKATVLSKATEYIRHLEKRNNRLQDENSQMQQRIGAFEKLFMNGALSNMNPMSPMAQPSPVGMQFGAAQPDPSMAAFMGNANMAAGQRGPDPQGMIPVPEEMKRILQAQAAAGRPYPVPQQPFQASPAIIRQQQIQQQQQMQQNRWQNAGPYLGKMMVGSLAGLMIFEAAREQEQDPENTQGRGLFSIPLQLLRPLVSSTTHIRFGSYYVSTAQIFSHIKLLLLFGLVLWAFVPSFFAPPKPKQQKLKQASSSLQAAPSLASPIHIRRQAWLTAIQTVWVPRHNFILEAAALVLKMMKLSVRNAFGVQGYQTLTGLTQEQETARVKAWTIALDAQLAGGDVEINESRLTLTLLASHTLPDTPLRLILNALHIRVLVRHLGKNKLFDAVAAHWARNKWNAAREQNTLAMQLQRDGNSGRAVSGPSLQADDELPSHLATLLSEECDDVLNDDVIQRAYNLAFNRPTTVNVPASTVDMDGMNAVVEDPAVRSPMDAVAAWFSNQLVHRVLAASLAADTDEAQTDVATSITAELDLAAKIAPIGSHAQVRALVARAVLIEDKRGASIATALQALRPSLNPDKQDRKSVV